jgi:hypothetical protein
VRPRLPSLILFSLIPAVRSLFRRYPFTLAFGLSVVACGLMCYALLAISVVVHWDHPGPLADRFYGGAVFLGRISTFFPSLLWTHQPTDPHSVMPEWFRPLVWLQGFIFGALVDLIFHLLRSARGT